MIRKTAQIDALVRLGIMKYATVGTSDKELYSPSTGDSGRLGPRTNEDPEDQVNTHFTEHDRHLDRDPADQSTEIPAGSWQSKSASRRKLQGRKNFRGLKISIENRKGGVRKWYDPHNDEKGRTKMLYPYGYIKGTVGTDGDHVDCFIGPNEDAKYVYIIDTNKAPDFKQFDEQKCMLGFDSREEAKNAYLAHYNDARFFRDMKEVPFDKFKEKVLKTLHSRKKKLASNTSPEEQRNLIDNGRGPSNDRVPGDYLGHPRTSLVGLRNVLSETDPQTKIDKEFSEFDQDTDTQTIDGNSLSTPTGPAV